MSDVKMKNNFEQNHHLYNDFHMSVDHLILDRLSLYKLGIVIGGECKDFVGGGR